MKTSSVLSKEALTLMISEIGKLVEHSANIILLEDRSNKNAIFNLQHSFVKDIQDCRDAVAKNTVLSDTERYSFTKVIDAIEDRRKTSLSFARMV